MADSTIASILIVEDEFDQADILKCRLNDLGYRCNVANSANAAKATFESTAFDAVILDWQLKDNRGGADFLQFLSENFPASYVVVYSNLDVNSECTELGADDFVRKDEHGLAGVILALRRGLRRTMAKVEQQLSSQQATPAIERLIGSSPEWCKVLQHIETIARSNAPVLISGETGTGKELVATAIHESSSRKDFPFVTVFCPGVAESTIESELFGHTKNAFTGAETPRAGLFEFAHRGTVLLDEITEIPQAIQAKLLRVVQYGMIRRIGSHTEKQIDVRILATSNRQIQSAISEGRLRNDLYHRLGALEISLPAVRERRVDVPDLLKYFLKRQGANVDKLVSPQLLSTLMEYDFPGNVREIEWIAERLAMGLGTGLIDIGSPNMEENKRATEAFSLRYEQASRYFLSEYLDHWMTVKRGNVSSVARATGINRNRIYAWLKETKRKAESFR